MDIESDQQLSRVYAAMDAKTRNFLPEFKSKLDSFFPMDKSISYLKKMEDHLEKYYADVNEELEEKIMDMSREIEELLEKAQNLKTALRDTQFELFLNKNNEMPLVEYKEKLEQDLSELHQMYATKKVVIDECLLEQKVLCEELGEEPRGLSSNPLATETEIAEFKSYLAELEHEKIRRINEIANLQQTIQELCNEMGISINESASLEPTLKNIARLQSEVAYYEKKRETIKSDCEEMVEKLELLWECLDAPASIRSHFRNLAKTYTQESLEKLSEEYERCKVMKQQHIKGVIMKMREKIVYQWNKIFKSEKERAKFNDYFESTFYTESLLDLHEREFEECKRFYQDNKNIFELFQERNEWFEKKKALDAKQNDRNRYNNRGGQLLKEEKERKLMDMKIPKIENEIKILVQEYQQQNQQDFLINGESIIELMDKDWENYRGTKELQKSARKAIATPIRGGVPKTPMSVRGQVSMKRVASNSNLGMSTGNLAKKRHLELPGNHAATSIKKANVTSTNVYNSKTKRNLLSQMESTAYDSRFTKPKSALKPPPTKSLANRSAQRIINKYRRSSRLRPSNVSVTDESLLDYDAFESKMRSAEITNSSVVEQQENKRENVPKKQSTMLPPKFRTPIKFNNNTTGTKSPLKPSNYRLQTKNVVDLV